MARLLLVILLLNGLVPTTGETVADAIQLAWTGSAARSVTECAGGCEDDAERGCGTQHHCTCCRGLSAVAQVQRSEPAPAWRVATVRIAASLSPPTRSLEPPYRPPIV